jgi:hypothetical protein
MVTGSNNQSSSDNETDIDPTQQSSTIANLFLQSSRANNLPPQYSTTDNPTHESPTANNLLLQTSVSDTSLKFSADNSRQQSTGNKLLFQASTTNIPVLQSSITDNSTHQSSAANNLLLRFPTTNSPELQSSYETAARTKTENVKSSEHDDLQTASQILEYRVWGYNSPIWPGWGYGRPGWGYGRPGWEYGRPGWGYRPYW